MNFTRRQFLRLASAMGMGVAGASVLERFALTTALAGGGGDEKYLICFFLNGGNDGNQTVCPLSGAPNFPAADVTGGFPAYQAARQGQGLYIPPPPDTTTPEAAGQWLRVSPNRNGTVTDPIVANLGLFGLHYNFGVAPAGTAGTTFRGLYNANQAAVVANVGTLGTPISKSQYQSSPGLRPSQLFSHSDQISQNQTCYFNGPPVGGWGGRVGDRTVLVYNNVFSSGGAADPFRLNMNIGIGGSAQFLGGTEGVTPLVMASFNFGTGQTNQPLNNVFVLNGFGTSADEVARRTAFNNLLTINVGRNKLVDATNSVTEGALAVSNALNTSPVLRTGPAPGTQFNFPNVNLSNQITQVCRIIKANKQQSALRLRRMIFFVSLGGYDTHQNQNAAQPGLLLQVGQAMAGVAYWAQNETDLGNIWNQITMFTLSDFNRTFNPAGTGGIVGSDHAWGNHFLVAGGAVNGGRFYGVPLPGGNGTVFNSLNMGGGSAYDTDTRGRWIPGTSTLQYANSLARWFGLPQDNATLDYAFPLLRTNFGNQGRPIDLGFMA